MSETRRWYELIVLNDGHERTQSPQKGGAMNREIGQLPGEPTGARGSGRVMARVRKLVSDLHGPADVITLETR